MSDKTGKVMPFDFINHMVELADPIPASKETIKLPFRFPDEDMEFFSQKEAIDLVSKFDPTEQFQQEIVPNVLAYVESIIYLLQKGSIHGRVISIVPSILVLNPKAKSEDFYLYFQRIAITVLNDIYETDEFAMNPNRLVGIKVTRKDPLNAPRFSIYTLEITWLEKNMLSKIKTYVTIVFLGNTGFLSATDVIMTETDLDHIEFTKVGLNELYLLLQQLYAASAQDYVKAAPEVMI